MLGKISKETKNKPKLSKIIIIFIIIILAGLILFFIKRNSSTETKKHPTSQLKSTDIPATPPPQLDITAYNKKLLEIANNPVAPTTTASSTLLNTKDTGWPVKTVYPNYGALLPFNRIVAYYGNLYSKGMGVLGEYPEDVMLNKLANEVVKWQTADKNTPVIPALHYIAVVAQAGGGRDGKFRARMPDAEIDKVLAMAKKINGVVFLDIQIAQSDVQTEIPLLEKYLKLPQVHLGIDPEFAMNNGAKPGKQIGTLDAEDINYAANYLAKVVKENNLPPKILIIHRFTRPMVTNYKHITPLPEVQIVMDMDGFGSQGSKLNTYKQFIYKEPVQFTGFKLFYKNDAARGEMLIPAQLLKLSPIPVYIQYQ